MAHRSKSTNRHEERSKSSPLPTPLSGGGPITARDVERESVKSLAPGLNSVLHIHLPFLTPPLGPLKGTFGSFLSQTEHLPSRTCFSSRAPAQKAHPLCSVVGVRDGGSAWAATSSFPSSYPNQPPHPVDFTFKMPLNPSRQLFSRFTHLAVPQSTFFCLVTAGDQCTQRFPHFCSCLSRTHQSLSAEAGLSGGLTAPPPKGLPAALRTKTNSLPWPTKL